MQISDLSKLAILYSTVLTPCNGAYLFVVITPNLFALDNVSHQYL